MQFFGGHRVRCCLTSEGICFGNALHNSLRSFNTTSGQMSIIEFSKDVFSFLLSIPLLPATFEDVEREMESIASRIEARIIDVAVQVEGTNARLDITNERLVQVEGTNARLDITNERLATVLTKFTGYKKTTLVSHEHEVVHSVMQFFEKKGMILDGRPYLGGEKIRDAFGETVAEVDGLLFWKEEGGPKKVAALVEVKSKVEKKALKQVRRAAVVLQQQRALDEVMNFVGGPLMREEMKLAIMSEGMHVVMTSGDRYKVIVPE